MWIPHACSCQMLEPTIWKTLQVWNGMTQRSIRPSPLNVYKPKTKWHILWHFTSFQRNGLWSRLWGNPGYGPCYHGDQKLWESSSVKGLPKSKANVVKEYHDVFVKSVGRFDGAVTLQISERANPEALPSRRVPIALQDPVNGVAASTWFECSNPGVWANGLGVPDGCLEEKGQLAQGMYRPVTS